MKRWMAMAAATVCLLGAMPMTMASAASAAYVTDFDYVQMTGDGVNGTMLYTAYDADGSLVLGTLNEQGEQTREAYSATRWAALSEPSVWQTTVHGDAADLCPYADTHRANTVCPYADVLLVTMRHTTLDLTLEKYYVPSEAQTLLPEGSVHFCFGRYGYTAPLTLKWEKGQRYMALKNSDGKWGVLDTQTGAMATEYVYADMDVPYGDYVKVSNGTKWGRLDVSGVLATKYRYADVNAFSVREEAREVEGGLRIFSEDNEIISPVIVGEFESFRYSEEAHLLLATSADGSSAFYDVTGEQVTAFEANLRVRHLQNTCYAVENTDGQALVGTALLRVDGAAHPDETVVKGDVTMDGLFNTSDVRAILLHALSDQPLTHRQTVAADYNSDGGINTTDAKKLLQRILQ